MQKVPIWSHSHLYPTSARWFRTTWEKNDKGMNWGRVIMAGMVVKARNNQHPWQFWRWKTIENTKQMNIDNIGIKIKIKIKIDPTSSWSECHNSTSRENQSYPPRVSKAVYLQRIGLSNKASLNLHQLWPRLQIHLSAVHHKRIFFGPILESMLVHPA